MKIRLENWMGYEIRFVEVKIDEWWAVAKDIADALGYSKTNSMTKNIKSKFLTGSNLAPMNKKYTLINEQGIYKAIFRSQRPEAEAFEDWVCDVLSELRRSSGLQAFQMFRMLDKEHQREAMKSLKEKLRTPVRVDFIKANTIANKAVSSVYGHPKMIKKDQMTPEMLVQRQDILDDAVNLMGMSDKFKLNLSVSQTIYDKYLGDLQRNREAN
ncbi:BRO family protein [Paenibacillus sp. FSL R5-0486]|uniref:BRO-N domain-containing protein n=1 Tax=Paenibacillus sp. FSL R5-0486 TaxID=2921645 RepID=UPI0030D99401